MKLLTKKEILIKNFNSKHLPVKSMEDLKGFVYTNVILKCMDEYGKQEADRALSEQEEFNQQYRDIAMELFNALQELNIVLDIYWNGYLRDDNLIKRVNKSQQKALEVIMGFRLLQTKIQDSQNKYLTEMEKFMEENKLSEQDMINDNKPTDI